MKNNLDSILLALLGSKELVLKWWNSPNRAFDGDTPQQLFDNQETYKKVADYIYKQLEK